MSNKDFLKAVLGVMVGYLIGTGIQLAILKHKADIDQEKFLENFGPCMTGEVKCFYNDSIMDPAAASVATSVVVTPGSKVTIQSNGTNWIVGKAQGPIRLQGDRWQHYYAGKWWTDGCMPSDPNYKTDCYAK